MNAERIGSQGIGNFDGAPRKEIKAFPRIGLMFPGQSSQEVGMGKNLFENSPAAKKVFEEANGTLGFNLAKLCFEGPKNELNQTHNTQPATLTTSIAALEAFKEKFGIAPGIVAAGHSVGEYAALVAAGSLSFPDALRLVRKRGHFMHEASIRQKGFMAAVIGLDESVVEEVCQHTDAKIANVNSRQQIVISGLNEGFAHASDLLTRRGARIIRLEVEGAFHSRLMESAAEEMIEALHKVRINDPTMPVIGNTSALPMHTSSEVQKDLQRQIVGSVNWLASMLIMIDMGVEAVMEIGHGKVLTGLARRINKDLKAFSVSNVLDIQSLALNPSV
ncbi:MAG: ACP S-malonyltransferase [Candidatus Levybacteria bacterium]|nr:ACP S-malonyltransferase [Candidatus Levybacteria bacterium]